MTLPSLSLDDKYTRESGRIYLTGVQALVRLLLTQARRDRRAGLATRGFVSGYRGSPLGGLDLQLAQARNHLDALGIRFQPGLNEELAMTAVWGTQMLEVSQGATQEGVFGVWYGKAPGLDRSGDALKHGSAAGSAKKGGVLLLVGDDPEAKSSTLPSQSEFAIADAGVPVLHPASVQDVLEYGVHSIALSRFAGCWAGLICQTDVMDGSASVDAGFEGAQIALPALDTSGLHYRVNASWREVEPLVFGARLDAARAFVRANHLDRVIAGRRDARLGIVTTGKASLDVLQALEDLGLDPQAAGIRIYKVAMPWPLETSGILEFAQGLDEILVVEQKRDLIESQLKAHLHDAGRSLPRVVGKRDEAGRPLLPSSGALSPEIVARAIASRLPERLRGERVQQRLRRIEEIEHARSAGHERMPFFCSGCPHNVSTRLPEGSRGLAGIGCHYMVQWMDRYTETHSQMGGEGIQWIGQAPFTSEPHVFTNLGDGTYFHSGSLAIRAAVAAGVNITFKLLFNDAVAMTGGQSADGAVSVPQTTRQLAAEGVCRIAVVTDEPGKYPPDANFAEGTTIHPRKALAAVQRELRATPGCTVLLYDQTCAAELRRQRKRRLIPERERRVFINEAVCEGCGDCSAQSNCVSVEPVETPFGRKRRINQTSCNRDYSCTDGLCPSFVTVRGGKLRRSAAADDVILAESLARLPVPAAPRGDAPWNLVITGIGGTGVVTVGALIGMAAHLEGRTVSVLDQTGLAQKGGAVLSHVRVAGSDGAVHGSRVPSGEADALLACDLIVAAGDQSIPKLDRERTRSVVNTHVVPTGEFVLDPSVDYDSTRYLELVHDRSKRLDAFDASDLATRVLGDAVGANVLLLGYAFQEGLIGVAAEALERAIELNGVAVEANLRAFRWGRVAAGSPNSVPRADAAREPAPESFEQALERRTASLRGYQNEALAHRYRALVDRVGVAEQRVSSGNALAFAAARGYFKLLAYKDEYEVARLYTNGEFQRWLAAQLEGDYRLEVQLAPPLFARVDPDTGRPRKTAFGPWMLRAMRVLARLKFLRGSPFDPFGYTQERRMERASIVAYECRLEQLLERLTPMNHATAVEIAALPLEVRGFGAVKLEAQRRAEKREALLLDRFFKEEHGADPA